MADMLLPTSLVGSYVQPEWLIDRTKLAARFPPRVRAKELWRVAPELLEQAQDDATLLAIRDQERAGLDIITDGEMRFDSGDVSAASLPHHIEVPVSNANFLTLEVLDGGDGINSDHADWLEPVLLR